MNPNNSIQTQSKEKSHPRIKSLLEYATLSKPRHRITVWAILTVAIFISRFSWLENLSILKALGWESAPSIGLTRAYWYLIHGKFYDAYKMNPLIFVVLAIGVPILLCDAYKILKRNND